MPLPSSTTPWVGQALIQVLGQAAGTKAQAVEALATLQAGPISSLWIFNFLDQVRAAIDNFDRFKAVVGLNSYAQAQIPNYSGTMVNDITTVQNTLQECLNWVIANFPKDSTDTWIQAFQLQADGRRTPRNFSSAQTAGLQTRLQEVINAVA